MVFSLTPHAHHSLNSEKFLRRFQNNLVLIAEIDDKIGLKMMEFLTFDIWNDIVSRTNYSLQICLVSSFVSCSSHALGYAMHVRTSHGRHVPVLLCNTRDGTNCSPISPRLLRFSVNYSLIATNYSCKIAPGEFQIFDLFGIGMSLKCRYRQSKIARSCSLPARFLFRVCKLAVYKHSHAGVMFGA